MTFDENIVKRVASLAKLSVPQTELVRITNELETVLRLIEAMQRVDTNDVTPMTNPHDSLQRLRADIITEGNQREKILSVAPETEDGHILVPRVVE